MHLKGLEICGVIVTIYKFITNFTMYLSVAHELLEKHDIFLYIHFLTVHQSQYFHEAGKMHKLLVHE